MRVENQAYLGSGGRKYSQSNKWNTISPGLYIHIIRQSLIRVLKISNKKIRRSDRFFQLEQTHFLEKVGNYLNKTWPATRGSLWSRPEYWGWQFTGIPNWLRSGSIKVIITGLPTHPGPAPHHSAGIFFTQSITTIIQHSKLPSKGHSYESQNQRIRLPDQYLELNDKSGATCLIQCVCPGAGRQWSGPQIG